MKKQNEEIRKAIKNSGLKHWEVAYALGVNDGNFSRKLRIELSEAEKTEILDIIMNLSQQNMNE